jgi:hypothetical protein
MEIKYSAYEGHIFEEYEILKEEIIEYG